MPFLADIYQCFERTYCLHLPLRWRNRYFRNIDKRLLPTRRHIPNDFLHGHRREHLKSPLSICSQLDYPPYLEDVCLRTLKTLRAVISRPHFNMETRHTALSQYEYSHVSVQTTLTAVVSRQILLHLKT